MAKSMRTQKRGDKGRERSREDHEQTTFKESARSFEEGVHELHGEEVQQERRRPQKHWGIAL